MQEQVPVWNRELTRLEELQCAYSDVFKDVNGFRPRFMTTEQWNDEQWLSDRLNDLYADMKREDQYELDCIRAQQAAAQAEADALNAANAALKGSEQPLRVSLFDLVNQ